MCHRIDITLKWDLEDKTNVKRDVEWTRTSRMGPYKCQTLPPPPSLSLRGTP